MSPDLPNTLLSIQQQTGYGRAHSYGRSLWKSNAQATIRLAQFHRCHWSAPVKRTMAASALAERKSEAIIYLQARVQSR